MYVFEWCEEAGKREISRHLLDQKVCLPFVSFIDLLFIRAASVFFNFTFALGLPLHKKMPQEYRAILEQPL